jgi:hypothetical protein
LLVPAPQYRFAENLLRTANVRAELLPAPSPRDVLLRRDERLFEELSKPAPDADASQNQNKPQELAQRLIEALGAEAAVEALLQRVQAQGPCAPLPITEINAETPARRPNVTRHEHRVPERRPRHVQRR